MADNHKPEKPAVLYKYLPADRALEALPEDGNGALRATQPAALNDPFEYATYCDTADPDKKEKSQEMARVLSEIIPEHPVYVDKVENSLDRIGSQSWNELFRELSCPPKLDPVLMRHAHNGSASRGHPAQAVLGIQDHQRTASH